MKTATKTLADLGAVRLYDAPTGDLIPDDPSAYEVIEHEDEGQREYALVRGPSGDTDVWVRDITGDRLYRDVVCGTLGEFRATY